MGSDNDIDVPVGNLELSLAQGKAFAPRMAAGPQVELPAVPRADDVLALRVVLQHPGLAVFVHQLAGLPATAGLARPPPPPGTFVVPPNGMATCASDAR